jgi:hypothetical protein
MHITHISHSDCYCFCQIWCSDDKFYENNCLLRCNRVQTARSVCIFRRKALSQSSGKTGFILKMVAACSSERSVNFYKNIWRHIQWVSNVRLFNKLIFLFKEEAKSWHFLLPSSLFLIHDTEQVNKMVICRTCIPLEYRPQSLWRIPIWTSLPWGERQNS